MQLRNFIAPVIVVLIFAAGLTAQSTSMTDPTPLVGEYIGKGPNKETSYYFNFTGGPGNVSVALEIKAKDYSTFARIEIGNDPSNLIAMANMNASTTTGPASVTKEFTLDAQKTIRIKVTLDTNLAEYKLSINGVGGGLGNGGGRSTGSSKTGTVGKIGKVTTGNGSKVGALGSSGGGKPKFGTQGSNGGNGNKMSFTCPNDVMYKIVPTEGWSAGLYSQTRYLFAEAAVAETQQLWCSYDSLTGGDRVTLSQVIPAGYNCELFNSGPKSKTFTCTQGVTASLIAPRLEWILKKVE